MILDRLPRFQVFLCLTCLVGCATDDDPADLGARPGPLDGGTPADAASISHPDADVVVGAPDASGCSSEHPMVGHTTALTTRAHGVSDTATIVDDCTIEVTHFDFDGQGLEVRIYGAHSELGGSINELFAQGFPMSDDLLRPVPYDDEVLRAELPAGRTLDDLDGISVWCVPAGASFGDGFFQSP